MNGVAPAYSGVPIAGPGHVSYQYEVTHPEGACACPDGPCPRVVTFATDVLAYNDITRHPGSGITTIKVTG
jgi:hypothetical protein